MKFGGIRGAYILYIGAGCVAAGGLMLRSVSDDLVSHLRTKRLVKTLAVILALTLSIPFARAQDRAPETPEPVWVGAEVFIERGQTAAEIDTFFLRLKEAGMPYARIRLFERDMRDADGAWNFHLFDEAYRAAERHNVRIYGNLFPATSFEDFAGFKFPRTTEHWQRIRDYIAQVVPHFRQFKSCYGWVPLNEPGTPRAPNEPFTEEQFRQWSAAQVAPSYRSDGYNVGDYSAQRFLVWYTTWYLEALTAEIRRYDPTGAVHVNNHAIFQNVAGYDLRSWTRVLTSLGGSAHPSWHFGYFRRDQYAVAFSANAEILRSGAGGIPWFMTEIQGGNNTYSVPTPICPTPEEIAQWIWLTYATGGRGAMFWCMNPRRSGIEAGEWAMLDFQNKPSERLTTATTIAGVVAKDSAMWARTQVAESGISILYTRESLWIESKLHVPGSSAQASNPGGVMKSAVAYFEALSELGLQANLQPIDEYDFNRPNFEGRTIILAHQISLPSRCWPWLEQFVRRGGKLLVDGLTGYYDENAYCAMGDRFPLTAVFGGTLKEVQVVSDRFAVHVEGNTAELPAHLWRGSIASGAGKAIAHDGSLVTGVRNRVGLGEVVWIPSLLGLGARIAGDYTALQRLLSNEARIDAGYPVRFAQPQPLTLLKTVRTQRGDVTVIVNKGPKPITAALVGPGVTSAVTLYANRGGAMEGAVARVAPEETLVVHWTPR